MLDNYGPNQLKVKHIYVHVHAYNAYVHTYTDLHMCVCYVCMFVCGGCRCMYLSTDLCSLGV